MKYKGRNHNLLIYRGEQFNPNFYYLTGFDIDHAFYYNETVFVPEMNYEYAKNEYDNVKTYKTLSDLSLAKELKIDLMNFPASLIKKLEKYRIIDASKELLERRMTKKKNEVTKIANATKISKKILEQIMNKIDCKETEKSIEFKLKVETLKKKCELAFDPIVATGKSTKYPHYKATEKKITKNTLIDFGVKNNYYCSDLTRCITNGKIEKKYEELKGIFFRIIDKIPECENAGELAEYAENEVAKLGKMPHLIGHGVGLEVHEYPRLNKNSTDKLEKTVFAIEPAIYTKEYGLRYEETIYYDGQKVKIL